MSYKAKAIRFPKRLSLVRIGREFWIQSQYTGEIVKPYDFAGIVRMIQDMKIEM